MLDSSTRPQRQASWLSGWCLAPGAWCLVPGAVASGRRLECSPYQSTYGESAQLSKGSYLDNHRTSNASERTAVRVKFSKRQISPARLPHMYTPLLSIDPYFPLYIAYVFITLDNNSLPETGPNIRR